MLMLLLATGCADQGARDAVTGRDFIAAGQRFDAGTSVVLWSDPGGFNAYETKLPRGGAAENAKLPPHRFAQRLLTSDPDPAATAPPARTLHDLRSLIDQIVIHYDGTGTSERCFAVLQKRGLSAHFLIDFDGTVYQTLDLRQRAWHATISNNRSIGIEIANLGALPIDKPPSQLDPRGVVPHHSAIVAGVVQHEKLHQYAFTDAQYDALAQLVAALRQTFPLITHDCPADENGVLIPHQLTREQWASYRGILGHYHVQANKVDPGPAFEWKRLAGGPLRGSR